MPFAHITTNAAVDAPSVARRLSALVAEATGKPEGYVMCLVTPGAALTFGGTDEPAAYVALKNIGMTEAACRTLAATLSEFVEAECGAPASRVFIDFKCLDGAWFAHNGRPLR